MIRFMIVMFFLLLGIPMNGQLIGVPIGSASFIEKTCYEITPALQSQQGGVWYNNSINFDEDFEIEYQGYFGNQDVNGADGIALVFKQNSTPELGVVGSGMGYQGILESLIVEFDTFQNLEFSDIIEDHISIVKNGDPNHTSANTLFAPVPASSTSNDIEDGINHNILIEWDASSMNMRVSFDCDLRAQYTGDIKNDVFSGNNIVYFGFVAATGFFFNENKVCFSNLSFVDDLILQDAVICLGESIQPDATIDNGITYNWTPIDGVSNANIANPVLSPTVTTFYKVAIRTACDEITEYDMEVKVLSGAIPAFDEVASICSGTPLTPLPTTSNNGIAGSWSPNLNATESTTYTFTPDYGSCGELVTLEIVVLQDDVTITTKQFPEGTALEVLVSVDGVYEYRLNNGEWQSNPIFTNLEECQEYQLFVRGASLCEELSTSIVLLDYPKFFTPNGDMLNDRWNIRCLLGKPNSVIAIFDKYGKLLKQFNPNQSSWDGIFNGKNMPAADYWFLVKYDEPLEGTNKEIRGHFALIR